MIVDRCEAACIIRVSIIIASTIRYHTVETALAHSDEQTVNDPNCDLPSDGKQQENLGAPLHIIIEKFKLIQ